MSEIKVGDHVSVPGPKYERGVVKAIWGAFASVEFAEGARHVPLVQLRSHNEEEPSRNRALAFERAKRLNAKKQEFLPKLRELLNRDFLGVDERFYAEFPILEEEDLACEKRNFVREWIGTVGTRGGTKLRIPDLEQATAISSFIGNTQVVARAGSGKTTTVVNRTLFLLKHCRIAPNEVLLLAFNRKAALEIRQQLLIKLVPEASSELEGAIARARAKDGGGSKVPAEIEAAAVDAITEIYKERLPHVMTWHSLAYAIVHPEGNMLMDGDSADSFGLSRVVQDVIDEFLQRPDFRDRIRDLMMAHFREDWDSIVDAGLNLSKADILALRRSLPRETLAGELVKSRGEKVIADFLFEHDVPYKYERNHWWDGVNYKPDFTVFKTKTSGVIIEYFGLTGDERYDEQTRQKKAYWAAKKDWVLIDLYPNDIAGPNRWDSLKKLSELLSIHGIHCSELTDTEIWQRIKQKSIRRFTRVVSTFIGRARKKSWSPLELKRQVGAHIHASDAELKFLSLGIDVFGTYLERLEATGDDDFDGLLLKAARSIDTGSTAFLRKNGGGDIKSLKFVCIDEFQDFSELFHRIVLAMMRANQKLSFFCVGDDWQAINGFAGSELRFFEDFTKYFGPSKVLHIATNYRSAKRIVELGNEVMVGKGHPARANKPDEGNVWVCDIRGFEPSLIEKQRYPGDLITPVVARLAYRFVSENRQVVLLSRRNTLPWYFDAGDVDGPSRTLESFLLRVRSALPKDSRDMVSISTAHKFKGLEKSAVIVLDAVTRSYPLIHPDWSFFRVFGDNPASIEEDERRLFYVSLTRAIDSLVIITDETNQSPFLKEMRAHRYIPPLSWKEFPAFAVAENRRLMLRVKNAPSRTQDGGTFNFKDQLSAYRFQYHGGNRCWERSMALENFDLNAVKVEAWSREIFGVEAAFFDETNTMVASYEIDRGQWRCHHDHWYLMQTGPQTDSAGISLRRQRTPT